MQTPCLRYLPSFFLALFFAGTASAYESPNGVIAASGSIQVAFTPDEDANTLILQAIYDARKQILVQAYSFTSKSIAGALINARRRGVEVQLIADAEQTQQMEHNQVSTVAALGVQVFIDSQHSSAHNKVMIIDAGMSNAVVITGSFNFSHAAQYKNAENLLLFRHNQELTAAYLKNWMHHREHSQAFGR
ncbi:MAG TPA: phospholipase D family protein [Sulfuricella sp.]|nr:phospholipase D family protein [Sulfuricella sp.]